MANIDKKILIVEDDEDFLFILEKVFTEAGFKIVTARDGELALEAILSEEPDLIMSDVLMPRMDGPALAKKLREQGNKTPIVFLTNIEEQKKDDNKEFDYLNKSKLQISEIVEKIKKKLKI